VYVCLHACTHLEVRAIMSIDALRACRDYWAVETHQQRAVLLCEGQLTHAVRVPTYVRQKLTRWSGGSNWNESPPLLLALRLGMQRKDAHLTRSAHCQPGYSREEV
jgi:hypothetical protein